MLNVTVNSYGHVRTVSSPNHTFPLGQLDQAVYPYFVYIISLATDNNPSRTSGRKDNDPINYFMITPHESMGPGRIELATPGSAVRHVSGVIHSTAPCLN